MREIAEKIGVLRESTRWIAIKYPKFKPYKLQNAHLLMDDTMRVRLQRCCQLLHYTAPLQWDRILFTGENFIALRQQNNRILSSNVLSTIKYKKTSWHTISKKSAFCFRGSRLLCTWWRKACPFETNGAVFILPTVCQEVFFIFNCTLSTSFFIYCKMMCTPPTFRSVDFRFELSESFIHTEDVSD